MIQPRVLKGFRDTLPESAIARSEMIRAIVDVLEGFGFVPIDTPALEYADILLGKGSEETDKQLYRFSDQGDRDIALRFDLTVPLARFVAMHLQSVGLPFRRYHIAPVWRAEKPQRGRYREFIQCDFDILGVDSVSADAEILAVANRVLTKLGVKHQIRINNRRILNAFLQRIEMTEYLTSVLRAIDKLEKMGEDAVRDELTGAGLKRAQLDMLFSFLAISNQAADNQELIEALERDLAGPDAERGIAELKLLLSTLEGYGVSKGTAKVDLSIARGLDYYTGTVFETVLSELPQIGSICSGGRYDDLTSLYMKQKVSGVGGSVGLDRLLAGLEELGRLNTKGATADVMIALLDEKDLPRMAQMATNLREAILRVEVYPEPIKLGNQLKYADRRGIRLVVIAGEREQQSGVCSVKDLLTGVQHDGIPIEGIISRIKELLKE